MRTYALVAAADFNAAHFSALYAAGTFDDVVAIDGGFAHVSAIGCSPDTVIGDFDSLGYIPNHPSVHAFDTHKDASDLDLAFSLVSDEEPACIYVYGALSGRLDHTLAALQVVAAKAEAGHNVTAVGDVFAVRTLAGPDFFEIPVPAGIDVVSWRGTVSVFAAGDKALGVTERGLEYPLENGVLTNRESLGLSNELVGEPASVSVEKGTLYVFYPLG